MSHQRRVILEYLRSLQRHASAEEVFSALKSRISSLGLGTVYRNLKFLNEHGYIEEIISGDHVAHYSSRVDAHLHFICEQCHKIYESDLQPGFAGELAKLRESGHVVRDGNFMFSGVCRSCAERMPQEKSEDTCAAYMKFSHELPIRTFLCRPCAFQGTCQYYSSSHSA